MGSDRDISMLDFFFSVARALAGLMLLGFPQSHM